MPNELIPQGTARPRAGNRRQGGLPLRTGRGLPGGDRRSQRTPERLRDRHGRGGTRRSQGSHRRARTERATRPTARHSVRREGPSGHRGRAHDVRIGGLRRPRARRATPSRSGASARPAPSCSGRPTRTSSRAAQPRTTRTSGPPTIRGSTATSPEDRAAAPRPPSPRAWRPWRPEATRVDRSACPPPPAAASASSPPGAA